MLVLTRRIDEMITVGDLVELRLIEVRESSLDLAIRFPMTRSPIVKVMLSLHQPVGIGDDVTVVALSCAGDHARIGITAPPELSITRRSHDTADAGDLGGAVL